MENGDEDVTVDVEAVVAVLNALKCEEEPEDPCDCNEAGVTLILSIFLQFTMPFSGINHLGGFVILLP